MNDSYVDIDDPLAGSCRAYGSCDACVEQGCDWNDWSCTGSVGGPEGSGICTNARVTKEAAIIVCSILGVFAMICIIRYCGSNGNLKNMGNVNLSVPKHQAKSDKIVTDVEQQISMQPIKQVVYVVQQPMQGTGQQMVYQGYPSEMEFNIRNDVPSHTYSNK
mmetsp:Transcript_86252/g.105841  ORF Transcript_86252/g.105841 Transcript_86252/m.105841 type:complete len:162 (-) Transcript_86252:26-511(-)